MEKANNRVYRIKYKVSKVSSKRSEVSLTMATRSAIVLCDSFYGACDKVRSSNSTIEILECILQQDIDMVFT